MIDRAHGEALRIIAGIMREHGFAGAVFEPDDALVAARRLGRELGADEAETMLRSFEAEFSDELAESGMQMLERYVAVYLERNPPHG